MSGTQVLRKGRSLFSSTTTAPPSKQAPAGPGKALPPLQDTNHGGMQPDPEGFCVLRLTQAQGRTFKVAGQRTWCRRLPPEQWGELVAPEMWEVLAGV